MVMRGKLNLTELAKDEYEQRDSRKLSLWLWCCGPPSKELESKVIGKELVQFQQSLFTFIQFDLVQYVKDNV